MALGRGDIWAGALAGYAASRIMDQATTLFYGVQTDASKAKEEELAPGGTLLQFGKQLGAMAGRELGDEGAGRAGLAAHRTLGCLYGVIATLLIRRGMHPLRAGLVTGAGAWTIVDEGTAIAQFTDYPVESHMRGVVGHATHGLAAGILLSLVHRK